MALLSIDLSVERLPRDKCYTCRMRRVLYRLVIHPAFRVNGSALYSVARCARCLGISP